MITANPTRTAERRERLAAYLREHVLRDGDFICSSEGSCRESCRPNNLYEGQLPHLGRFYDLEVDGVERRIVIVGQEYGSPETRVTLDQRTAEISKMTDWPFGKRNPHMRGTASLLRLLIGRDPGDDAEGEVLPCAPGASIYDGFALVNSLMCSAIDAPSEGGFSAPGKASQMMFEHCTEHLTQILAIMEPTIIVAQGISHVAWWLSKGLGVTPKAGHQSVVLNGRGIDLFTFAHPSAGGNYGYWGSTAHSKYLTDTVAPTIREYLTPIVEAK